MFGLGPVELLIIGIICATLFVLPIAIGVVIVVMLTRSSHNRERGNE